MHALRREVRETGKWSDGLGASLSEAMPEPVWIVHGPGSFRFRGFGMFRGICFGFRVERLRYVEKWAESGANFLPLRTPDSAIPVWCPRGLLHNRHVWATGLWLLAVNLQNSCGLRRPIAHIRLLTRNMSKRRRLVPACGQPSCPIVSQALACLCCVWRCDA